MGFFRAIGNIITQIQEGNERDRMEMATMNADHDRAHDRRRKRERDAIIEDDMHKQSIIDRASSPTERLEIASRFKKEEEYIEKRNKRFGL
jgi:hypothetical protein